MEVQATTRSMHTVILQDVSTEELLLLLGKFLCQRCTLLNDLAPDDPAMWLRTVDNFLLVTRWQKELFIVPGSVVFLFMLCRDFVSTEVSSIKELQAVVLTCFYITYSYMAHAISCPAKPFRVEEDSMTFWRRTLDIAMRRSAKMLKINNDPQFFAEVLMDLKNSADQTPEEHSWDCFPDCMMFMGCIYSTPLPESEKIRSKKRSINLPLPEPFSSKRRKIMKAASEHRLENPQAAGPSSEPKESTPASPSMDTPADVRSAQATPLSMHEVILQDVSTEELLLFLGKFLCHRCYLLKDLSPDDPAMWLRTVDDLLLVNRCQKEHFIVPGSVVFCYMLCRDFVSAEVSSMKELQAVVLTCFYVTYCYIGHELGWPTKPFRVEEDSMTFWRRTLDIAMRTSSKMMKMNNDHQFLAEVLADLKNSTDH